MADDAKRDGPQEALDLPDWMRPFAVVAVLAAIMWVVEIIDLLPRTNFDRWGIRPREMGGLIGIPLSPFLHNGIGHLVSNTIPFLILGWVIAASGIARYVQVTVIVAVVAGFGTWLVGPSNSLHLGASALVFGYLTYVLGRAVFERKIAYIVGGLIVLMLYGGVLWGLLPRPGISWQGHLFGALGGAFAARMLHGSRDEVLPDDDLLTG